MNSDVAGPRLDELQQLWLQTDGEKIMLSPYAWSFDCVEIGGSRLVVWENGYHFIDWALINRDGVTSGCLVGLNDPWLRGDLHRFPRLHRDQDGVVWVLWINAVRRRVLWAQWLGGGFSPVCAGPGIYLPQPHYVEHHLPIDEFKISPCSERCVGLELQTISPLRVSQSHKLTLPSLLAEPGRKILFLDLAELEQMDGLSLHPGTVAKHPDNPILTPDPRYPFEGHQVFGHGSVFKDGDAWHMFYETYHDTGEEGVPWYKFLHLGKARSKDGIHWQRDEPPEISGRFTQHGAWFDPDDPDGRRRFKLLSFDNSGEDRERRLASGDINSPTVHGQLQLSGDGRNWRQQEAFLHHPPGPRPLSVVPLCMFRDPYEQDPRRRYKAYGFSSLNLRRRGGVMVYSEDLVQWHPAPSNPVLDPMVRGVPATPGGMYHQVHDFVVWPHGGYYLGLYQYQVSPTRTELEVAFSRDGEHFQYLGPGHHVVERGPAGSWDCGALLPHVPVLHEGRWYVFYGGMDYQHESEVVPSDPFKACERAEAARCCAGLATLREDGLASLKLTDEVQEGGFVTRPIHPARDTGLFFNTACVMGAGLQVELADPESNEALPGFGRENAVSIEGDGVHLPVRWRDRRSVPARPFQLRVRFSRSAGGQSPHLFAIGWENTP